MGTHKTGMPTQGSTPSCHDQPRGTLGEQLPIIPSAHSIYGHSNGKMLCGLLSIISSELPLPGTKQLSWPQRGVSAA